MTASERPASVTAPAPTRPGPAGSPGHGTRPSGGRQLAWLAFDIGAPIAVYYLLRSLGASNLVALTAGAVLPALSAGCTLVVRRRTDGVALFVLLSILVSVTVSLVAHDPRFLLARDGLITGLWGLWFLASVRARRPAAFVFARPLLEGRRMFAVQDWDALWQAEPAFRRIWRVTTALWGTGMLADAATRVLLSCTLPVAVVPGLGGALWPVTFVVLQAVTIVYHRFAGLNRLLGARWLR